MFTNSASAIKNVCLSVLLTSIFCTALFFSQTVPASAQTGTSLSELQAQIATLMARITALQGGGASSPAAGSGGGGSSSSIRSYTLVDVTSVTKQFVDPNKAIADEEYNLYVITLKTGQKIEVKVAVRTVPGTAEEAFRKTGFVGSATELMSRATSSNPSDETFKVTISKFTATVSFTLSNGCGGYIISWGDGAKTELAGSAGRACTMAIVNVAKNHTYAKAGTYTVKVERFNGQTLRDTSTKEIKVGSVASTTPRIISLISTSSRNYVATIALGNPTKPGVPAVTGPVGLGTISWGDGITERINALATGEEMVITRNHTYKKSGTYTVLVRDTKGKTASQKVVVSGSSTLDRYELSIYSPAENTSFKTGDRVNLEWKTTNLTNEIASVILFGNNTERYMLRNIALNKGTASFVIPATDSLGPVVSGTYKILMAVVGTKDGDPKNVTDTVSISITRSNTGGSSSSSAASSTAPQKNKFGCDRSVAAKMASGSVACYGMWDYGNDFGGDVKMCGDYAAGKTGCVITTPVCTSGVAKATKYIGNSSLTTSNLGVISQRLGVSQAVSKAGIAGLWEYTCIAPAGGVSTPRVLGASIDIFSEISKTLTSIERILRDVK